MVEIMEKFARGEGSPSDITNLTDLSNTMMLTSLCGLGQAAPNAITDSLQHFKDAYESRLKGKKGA